MQVGDTLRILWTTAGITIPNVAKNADSTPTAALYRNGVLLGTAVTVANVTTGLYLASVMLASGDAWAEGDTYGLVATWTMDATAGIKQPVAQGEIRGLQARIAGLVQKNRVLTSPVYDGSGNLVSATLRLYDTAAHATLDDGVTGLIGSYSVVATYSPGTTNVLKETVTEVS